MFDESTPLSLIKTLRPNVLVKGGDYDPNEQDPSKPAYIVGSKEVKDNGGSVRVIPFLPGYSTSAIEDKIRSFS